MHYQLSKIEQLDVQFPGFADDIRNWLLQGIAAAKIPALLFEKYRVSVTAGMVGHFRSERWVPEQRLLREKKIAARAELEVSRDMAAKASMAERAPGDDQ
jgi:hypothetical protein